jgi:hypothetical protein
MEFFLPSLAALLLTALLIFFVLPKFGAPILVVLSIILLMYGVRSHIQLFAPEYRYSTWQEQLKLYAPFIIIAGLLLSILSYLGFLFGTKGVNALPLPNIAPAVNMPPANTATNPVTSIINSGLQAVNSVVNAVSPNTNNAKKNNFSLTSLITTPNNSGNAANGKKNFL